MNKKSQLQFAHRCSVLLESGISLSQAIVFVINLEINKNTYAALCTVKKNLEKGLTLARSLEQSNIKFEPTLLGMIRFGESAGILAPALRRGLEVLEKRSYIQKKLLGALIYPFFIGIATIAMSLFLVLYIFPKIIPLFSSLDIKLPLLTQLVMHLHKILSSFGIWFLGVGILFLFCFLIIYKRKIWFRVKFQACLFALPGLGLLFKKYFLASFCRTIGTLLQCGQLLPIILDQMRNNSSLDIYKKSWSHIYKETIKGVPVSMALRSFPGLFPQIVPDMLSIGESTGQLAGMFQHIGQMYEEELDDFTKQLSTIIEPVLMIGMGLIVGSVALSIILPIYEITNHLTR